MNDQTSRMRKRTLLFLPAKVIEGLVSVFTLSYISGLFTTVVNDDFVWATTAMNLAYILLFAWLANSASRYCGEYLLTGEREKERSFFSTLMLPFFVLSLAAFLLCGGLSLLQGDPFYFYDFLMLFGYGAFQVFSIVLVQTDRPTPFAVLSVAEAVGKLALCWILSRPSLFSAATPAAAMLAYAAADLAVAGIAAAIAGFFGRFSLRAFSRGLFRTFLSYGYPLIGVSFSVAMLNMAYRFLLEYYARPGDLAIYSNNASLSTTVFTMITVSLMRAAYPSILESWRQEGAAAAQRSVTAALRNYLLISVPAVCGLAAVARDLSGLILRRPDYAAGVPAVGLVAAAMFFSGLTEYANKGWELAGNTRPIFANSVLCALLNLALNWILLPRVGFLAAAGVLLVSYLLYFLLSYFRTRSLLRLRLPWRDLWRILLAGALCGVGAYAVSRLGIPHIARLCLSVAVGAALYLVTLLLTGEIREELAAVAAILKRRKNA